jgi:hypothetical protein
MTTAGNGFTQHRRPAALVGGALALAALLSAPGVSAATGPAASAAPNNANTLVLDLECSNDRHYVITVVEPAPDRAAVLVMDSRAVLTPTVFQWHIVVTDDNGNILDETTPPPQLVHGRSAEHHATMTCTFAQTAHHDSPDGGYTVRVEGTVQAFDPGSRATRV